MVRTAIDNAAVILVDYFDTLVFRSVTSNELINRWARGIGIKFPSLSEEITRQLPKRRAESFKKLREMARCSETEVTEVVYEDAIGAVYQSIKTQLAGVDEATFVSFAKNLDFDLECGCQYANRRLITQLSAAKAQGKRIYCVSDFYLNADYLRKMMIAANIPEGLLDGIFVSCDVGRRKALGDMYPYVLDALKIKPSDAVMIGDNPVSDIQKARENGLRAVLQRHAWHKVLIHLRAKAHIQFAPRQMMFSMNNTFRHGQHYGEYICIFYVFIKRLFDQLRADHVQSIAFMAREGFYLKELFELYQQIVVPEADIIGTSYYWCSRRSVMAGVREALMPEYIDEDISLKNWLKSLNLKPEDARAYTPFTDSQADEVCDLKRNGIYLRLMKHPDFRKRIDAIIEENNGVFRDYTAPYIKDGVFRFVDSGWKCTTQNTIQKNYGIPTKGYYIGVQNPDKPTLPLDRCGLIFSESNPRSKYYDYLGTNIPFYQQLLAAPHGTALKYVRGQDGIEVLHEWDQMEEKLYREHIAALQTYMLLKYRGLCVWDCKTPWDKKQDWYIARLSMRSSLFANPSRQRFIRMCTDNYVQNFRQENRGKVKYDPSKVKIGVDIIWKPEKYMRYISKIQRTSIYDHKAVRVIYPVLVRLYYGYTLMIHTLKH